MKIKLPFSLVLLMVLALSLVSCLDITDISREASPGELCLAPVSAAVTKAPIDGNVALPRYHTDGSTPRKLKVSAYWNAPAGKGTSADYFDNTTFTYFTTTNSKAQWQGGTLSNPLPKFWPAAGTLDMFAFCANGVGTSSTDNPTPAYNVGSKVSDGATITVGDNSSTQVDIVFGGAGGQTRVTDGNAMTMHHAQALVVFTAESTVARNTTANTGVTIKTITLNDAYFGGTLKMDMTQEAGNRCIWSSLTSRKTAAAGGRLLLNTAGTGNIAYDVPTTAMNVASSGNHFGIGGAGILVPEQGQTSIHIEYTLHNAKDYYGNPIDNDLSFDYVCSGTWQEGKKYIYCLKFNLNEIIVVPTVTNWADGGTENASVPHVDLSYRTHSGVESPAKKPGQ